MEGKDFRNGWNLSVIYGMYNVGRGEFGALFLDLFGRDKTVLLLLTLGYQYLYVLANRLNLTEILHLFWMLYVERFSVRRHAFLILSQIVQRFLSILFPIFKANT